MVQAPVDTPIRDMRYSPTVMRAVPTTGKTLYRPHLLTSRPEPMEATSSPPISGNRRTPDWMGLIPFTSWKKRGRKVRAPNMAKPDHEADGAGRGEDLVGEEGQGDDRLHGPALGQQEEDRRRPPRPRPGR